MTNKKSAKIELTKLQRQKIGDFVEQWEKMGNAYFWTPPQNAGGRRWYEKQNSYNLEIEIQGVQYTGIIDVSCSCNNIYVKRELLVNDEKKRITALKKLLK